MVYSMAYEEMLQSSFKMSVQQRVRLQDQLVDRIWSTLINHVTLIENDMSKAEILGCFEILKDKVLSTRGEGKIEVKVADLKPFIIGDTND